MGIQVLQPGLLTTVQDQGRFGHQRIGMSPAGAMDLHSMRLANLPCTVKPCTSAEYAAAHPESANRPAWSALENRALRCTVGDDMRDWKDAINDFFKNWDGE